MLSNSVLYYFDDPKSPAPKGLLPLEDVVVRHSSEKTFAFVLSSSEEAGAVLKSAKLSSLGGAGASSSLEAGRHTSFVFAAESAEDRRRWVRAMRESAISSRFQRRG